MSLTAADLDALRAVIREELARLAPRPPLPGLGAWTWDAAAEAWRPCGDGGNDIVQ